MYRAAQKAYTAFMPLVNALWYYASAKPESGYNAAVRGYAQKLADRLGYEAVALETDQCEALQLKAQQCGTPQMVLGAGEGVQWPSDMQAPTLMKARPYADQHGRSLSMHDLTPDQLDSARQRAQHVWQNDSAPAVAMCVANPHWLVSDGAAWAHKISAWLSASGVQTFYVTDSPRTNPLLWQAWCEHLQEALPPSLALHLNHCRSDHNHYQEMLSIAEAVLILGSSRSMAGEAAMTGAPVYYCADDAASEAAFFSDTPALIGDEAAARFQPFDGDSLCSYERHAPYDVTMLYVQETLKNLKAVKAA